MALFLPTGEVVEALVKAGAEDHGLLVQGKPGSGKSVLCRLVAHEWRKRNYGDVFYRPSGESPFTDEPGRLAEALERADGEVLVVAEDAARDEIRALYQVVWDFQVDPSVTFLLNARYDEWTDFQPAESLESDQAAQLSRIMESLPKAHLAPLDAAECAQIIDHYETTIEETVPVPGDDAEERGAALYERVETASRAGEMLHVSFLLAGTEGLKEDAANKVCGISRDEYGESSGRSARTPDRRDDGRGTMNDSDSERVQAADEAGEHLADADRDVTRGQRWYAKLYLTALFGAVGAAIAGSIHWGLIRPELVVTATVEVGWLLEYLVAGLVVASRIVHQRHDLGSRSRRRCLRTPWQRPGGLIV